MAKRNNNDTTRFADLKARVERLAHELVTDDDGLYYVFDAGVRTLTQVIGGTETDIEKWCAWYESPDEDAPRPRLSCDARRPRASATPEDLSEHLPNLHLLYSTAADLTAVLRGIDGIARSLDLMELDDHARGLVEALNVLARQLESADGDTPFHVKEAVERALKRPDVDDAEGEE